MRVRRTAATWVLAALVAALAPVRESRAGEEMPPAVAALADAGTREKAKSDLAGGADDEAVALVLRSEPLRSALPPAAAEALCDVVAARGLALANSGLRAWLRDADQPVAVRRAAARALEKTGTLVDVGALADALRDVPDECSRALAAIGGDSALAALRRAAGDDPPPEAVAAMIRLGERSRLSDLAAGLSDPTRAARTGELLRWATGRDLPDDAHAWLELAARFDLAERFAATDIDAAHAAVREIADSLRAGGAGGPSVEERVAAILADAGMPVPARARAALALGVAGVRTRNDLLLAHCANLQPGNLRWACANALARVGDLSCAVPLAYMLSHDEDRDRLAAKRTPRRDYVPVDPEFARVLTRLGLPGAPVALFDVLAGEYRSALQRDAVRAVQELSGGDAFGFDTDSAASDRRAAVERMRVWWLGARTGLGIAPRADDPGWARFRADVDAQIASLGAFKFLEQMRARKTLTIVAEGAAPQLVAALAHEDLRVRTGAAEVMQAAALREFAGPLAARLASDPNPAARARFLAALETCARPGRDGTVPAADAVRGVVRAALADRVIDVRIAAARTLGSVGDRTVDVEALRKARAEKRNATDDFRTTSAGALLVLGDRSAVADVLSLLASGEVALRAEGVRLLRAAGIDTRGFDPDATPEARAAALREIEPGVSSGGQR